MNNSPHQKEIHLLFENIKKAEDKFSIHEQEIKQSNDYKLKQFQIPDIMNDLSSKQSQNVTKTNKFSH